MKNPFPVVILFLLGLLFIFGCAAETKLADYQPKSAEEQEVLKFINECYVAYQDRNLTKWIACFNDNAKIKIPKLGSGYGRFVSKQEYKEHLEKEEYIANELINPYFFSKGGAMTIRCSSHFDVFLITHTFDMVKEKENWSITRWDYSWR